MSGSFGVRLMLMLEQVPYFLSYLKKGVQDLQQDLGLFGFFVALGRSTRAYLASRGVGDSEESLASLLRYLLNPP